MTDDGIGLQLTVAVDTCTQDVEFEGTKHVMHYQSHPEQYERAVARVLRGAFGDEHARGA
jgi:hypothetical protein